MEPNNTNNMQPKPGDVVKPDPNLVVPQPAPAPAPEPAMPVAPITPTPEPTPVVPPAPQPEPAPVVESNPATPVEPTPTITPAVSEPHKHNGLFAAILLVVLLLVGGMVYWMYFRQPSLPVVSPVEIRETTESTMPDRTQTQEDTTSLQYLETQFSGLDNSTTELTSDTEIQNQLNVSSSSTNTSEL